ncbi:MAG TPA: biotin carboxylase N-terminal domain-containing protein [Actinomycetes bacterium]|nr:biotin carboxylase N-terminal domain-containing protein [Actinomycetes bacterium]
MILRRLLVANRGEIAVRVLRSCQRLGIETVLAASEADLDSVPARMADRTVCIGPAAPAASYLDVDAVVHAAVASGADAVHPGYGFLAENRRLAEACVAAGVVFVGPTAAQLDAAGDKLAARAHAVAAGLPVLPGGPVGRAAEALRLAREVGWPVLVKAVGGGGGRGLRVVADPARLAETVQRATAEAGAAFGDPRVYLERFLPAGRHVEVQLLGDGQTVIHLGDRDCSVQRRYQKLLEEAPAPGLGEELRGRLHRAAVALGRRLGYRGLGTVEFLVDQALDGFFFLELNARIQVEHPVTEAVTGLDLVAEQLAVAEGRPLRLAQAEVTPAGHAIECRINAEDPEQDFRPSPGTVTAAVFPAGDGIRVDTHVQAGAAVPPHYDSLLAKLIVHGPDRPAAVARLQGALRRCEIAGVATNLALHERLVRHPEFVAGGVGTAFLGNGRG